MFDIEVSDEQDVVPVDHQRIVEITKKLLEVEQVAAAEISIALVDNPTIHELNARYLQHDFETDVISFLLDLEEPDEAETEAVPPGRGARAKPRGAGKGLTGEVILSTEMARDRAADFHWPAESEIALYLVHGLLHLCGYDDLTPREKRIMRAREKLHLAEWGITARYSDRTAK